MSGVLGTIVFFIATFNIYVTFSCAKGGARSYLESCDYGELSAKIICGLPGLIIYSIFHDLKMIIKKLAYIKRSLRDAIASQEYANIH